MLQDQKRNSSQSPQNSRIMKAGKSAIPKINIKNDLWTAAEDWQQIAIGQLSRKGFITDGSKFDIDGPDSGLLLTVWMNRGQTWRWNDPF